VSLAIIPARGGSKRIPGKNIRAFCGKPMINYAIDAAIKSGLFERVVVSTDSEEIAKISRSSGAETPFVRPAELADDFTNTDAVFMHALRFVLSQGIEFEYACCIYPTAPFIQPHYIQEGHRLLEESNAHNAFSVTTFPYPILRSQLINEDALLEMRWPEHRMTRSQDLPEFYHDAGQFYWTRITQYLTKPDLYDQAVPVVLPRHLVQDIDTEEDWKRAELMYKALSL
jgi:pseudaminic acid cytidylyltransferase